MGRTFEVDVVLVRNAEDIVALVGLYSLDEVPLGVLEVDLDASRGEQGSAKAERGGRRTQCLALAGLYQNAWQLDGREYWPSTDEVVHEPDVAWKARF